MTDLSLIGLIAVPWLLTGFVIDALTNRARHPNVSVWLLWPVLLIDLARSHLRANREPGDSTK